jgi:hypothetical protein
MAGSQFPALNHDDGALGIPFVHTAQRQQRMTPKCDDRSVFGLDQDGGSRLFRSGLEILDSGPFLPLGHRFRGGAQRHAQLRERSLRSLQCNSDGENGRRARAANLSHSASLQS